MPFFPEVSVFSRSSAEWFKLLYDDREMCSKPAPSAYSVSLATSHLVAAPIYAVAFYTLYAEKSANFKIYKKYLAVHAISNVLFELHLSVVMKPVLYQPYPMVRFTGAFNLCFINGGLTFFVFLLFIVLTCWSIIELFYFRFSIISKNDLSSKWVKQFALVIDRVRWLLMALSVSTVGCLPLCFVGLFDQTMHKTKSNLLDQFPEIMCTSAIILPRAVESGIKPIHLFNILGLFSVFVGTLLCMSCGIASLLALRDLVQQMTTSLRTIDMHKSFLISLFCQIGVHCCMLGFPVVFYILSLIFHFDGNEVGYVAIVMASLHGTSSTLGMILFNRPLSALAKSRILSFFTANNVAVREVSVVSMLRSQ